MKKSQRPTISIVMAVMNGMPFIKDSVLSILSQSYKNFEFIIVDDASTDKTWHFLKSQKDKRITLARNEKNLGLASSLNKAIEKARGQYIARMDSDDISLPKRLESQLKFMVNNPDVSICGCWAKIINENGKKIGKIHHPQGDKDIKRTLRRITPIIHPTWFAKKEIFKLLGGYKKEWDYVEDYDFLLRARKFKMANLNSELVLWRVQPSRRSLKNIQTIYEKSFKLRWKYFFQGRLDFSYLPYLLRSLISAYIIPVNLKIFLNKQRESSR